MRTLLCVLMVAGLTLAADGNATGKWTGRFNLTNPDGEMHESGAVLNLKQTGSEVTGSVGPNEEEQTVIQKGKIEGNRITMEAEHHGRTIKFDLVLAADRITGDASVSAEDGQTAKAKVDVTRTK